MTKHQMLAESIEQYREVFMRARNQFNKVVSVRLCFPTSFRSDINAALSCRAYENISTDLLQKMLTITTVRMVAEAGKGLTVTPAAVAVAVAVAEEVEVEIEGSARRIAEG